MLKIQPRPYLLINKIQHYDWGPRGENAFIPRFLGREASNNEPYAELWIGAHPKAPSDVLMDGGRVPLPDLIRDYPFEVLGRSVANFFSGKFPFLFKIVSVAEPLSIQAHPDKSQARSLHGKDPDKYPDDNHKPEIAIALDSFDALLGFRDVSEILSQLGKYPELASFINLHDLQARLGKKDLDRSQKEALLRDLVTSIVEKSRRNEDPFFKVIDAIYERLSRALGQLSEEETLFLDLKNKYPGDVGLLFIFLLRKVHVQRGQGFFVRPGTPHAYLRGNVVECMASSDNVVRAGLTKKYVDSATLVDILNYDLAPVPLINGDPQCEEFIYQTPVSEFRAHTLRLDPPQVKFIRTGEGPVVFLVMRGNMMIQWNDGRDSQTEEYSKGQAILIPAFLDELKIIPLDAVKMFKVDVPVENFRS